MSKNPREIKKKHCCLREILLSTVVSINLPPPVGRIKIIRRNGTNGFSDNSDLSVSESLGTVAPPLVSPLVSGQNSK